MEARVVSIRGNTAGAISLLQAYLTIPGVIQGAEVERWLAALRE